MTERLHQELLQAPWLSPLSEQCAGAGWGQPLPGKETGHQAQVCRERTFMNSHIPGPCHCSVAQSCPTLRPHELQPTRFLCPWDSPGKNIGEGHHFLLPGDLPNPKIEPVPPALPANSGSAVKNPWTYGLPNFPSPLTHPIISSTNKIISFF